MAKKQENKGDKGFSLRERILELRKSEDVLELASLERQVKEAVLQCQQRINALLVHLVDETGIIVTDIEFDEEMDNEEEGIRELWPVLTYE